MNYQTPFSLHIELEILEDIDMSGIDKDVSSFWIKHMDEIDVGIARKIQLEFGKSIHNWQTDNWGLNRVRLNINRWTREDFWESCRNDD